MLYKNNSTPFIETSNFTKGFNSNSSQLFENSSVANGITVKGSESNQKFKKITKIQTDEEEFFIILKLSGTSKQNKEVLEIVTKSTIKICTSCGSKWPYKYTFCPDDGTFLEDAWYVLN